MLIRNSQLPWVKRAPLVVNSSLPYTHIANYNSKFKKDTTCGAYRVKSWNLQTLTMKWWYRIKWKVVDVCVCFYCWWWWGACMRVRWCNSVLSVLHFYINFPMKQDQEIPTVVYSTLEFSTVNCRKAWFLIVLMFSIACNSTSSFLAIAD